MSEEMHPRRGGGSRAVLWIVAIVALGALLVIVFLNNTSETPSSGPTETAPAVEPDEPTEVPDEQPDEPTEVPATPTESL